MIQLHQVCGIFGELYVGKNISPNLYLFGPL